VEIESSLVAVQNQLTFNPTAPDPQRQAATQEQQNQRRNTELPRQQVVSRQNNPEAFKRADQFRQQQQQNTQSLDLRSRQAIDTYKTLANDQQRNEIQSLLGIDTYV
jgi:membrane protein involved in colicin uptake